MKYYYVYEIMDPRNHKVFYAGKGSNKRMYYHFNKVKSGHELNNKHLEHKLRQLLKENINPIYNKVFETNNEQEAFNKEIELILFYDKINLCNLTDEGESPSGHIPSKETIEKIQNKAIERCKSVKYREMISRKTKDAMNEPKFKEEFLKIVKSEDFIKNVSEKTKEAMNKPEIKQKMIDVQQKEKNGFFGCIHTDKWKSNHSKYMRENNPMKNKSVYDIWIEKYGIEIAEKRYCDWKLKLSEARQNRDK